MKRRLALLLGLSACASAPTINYAGTMQPAGGLCDPPNQATLTMRNTEVIFAPSAGTLLLRGTRQADAISASLTIPDANKHPNTFTFAGRLNGQTITGSYVTKNCRYRVILSATAD